MCFILMCIFCAPYTFKDLIKCFIIGNTVPKISIITFFFSPPKEPFPHLVLRFNKNKAYIYLILLTWPPPTTSDFLLLEGSHCKESSLTAKNKSVLPNWASSSSGHKCFACGRLKRETGNGHVGNLRQCLLDTEYKSDQNNISTREGDRGSKRGRGWRRDRHLKEEWKREREKSIILIVKDST